MTTRKPSPATLAARTLGSLGGKAGTEAQDAARRANGARGGRRATTYTLSSVKGQHGTVTGYRAACQRAREVQAEYQAAYGVDVSRPDGTTVYTAP